MPPRNLRGRTRKPKAAEVQTTDEATNEHLATVHGGLEQLVDQIKALRARNAELEAQLHTTAANAPIENTTAQARPKRGGSAGDARKIKQMEEKIGELIEKNKKLKRRIRELERQDIKKEVEDLQSGAVDGDDYVTTLEQLLRRYGEIMLEVAISDDPIEQCNVCLDENLVPGKCSVLNCRHIWCDKCIGLLTKGGSIECPQCRDITAASDVEEVRYTNTTWWDAMTDIAQQWAAVDKGGEENEVNEDEVGDGDNAESDGSKAKSPKPAVDEGSEQPEPAAAESGDVDKESSSTPPATPLRRLRPSGTPKKRKRIESEEDDDEGAEAQESQIQETEAGE